MAISALFLAGESVRKNERSYSCLRFDRPFPIVYPFMSGLAAGTGSAQGTRLQHQTSCRDVEAPIPFKN